MNIELGVCSFCGVLRIFGSYKTVVVACVMVFKDMMFGFCCFLDQNFELAPT